MLLSFVRIVISVSFVKWENHFKLVTGQFAITLIDQKALKAYKTILARRGI